MDKDHEAIQRQERALSRAHYALSPEPLEYHQTSGRQILWILL
jgi:hypothetical protein